MKTSTNKNDFLKLQEELKMKKKEIIQLRNIIKEMDTKQTEPTKENLPNSLKLIKLFTQFYMEKYNVGYYIANWANANIIMKKIIDAFYDNGETDKEIEKFFRWAIDKKTHTGNSMRLGYLPTIIQDYRDYLMTSTKDVSINMKIDENLLNTLFYKRFDEC